MMYYNRTNNCLYNPIHVKFNENSEIGDTFSYTLQYPTFFALKNTNFSVKQDVLNNINSTINSSVLTFKNGLMEEEKDVVAKLNNTQKMRIIKLMPLVDAKKELARLSVEQLSELADFAIEHYKDLSMDRVDVLSKASGRNILKSIENYKRGLED